MESSQKEDSLSGEASSEGKRCCFVCKTTKTPLWRSGPSGPKSLCNACGIKHRKKQPNSPEAGPPGPGKIGKKKKKGKLKNGLGVNVKRKQWSEVEIAALLLMALSCGAVFA